MTRLSTLFRPLAGAAAVWCVPVMHAASPVFPEHPNGTDHPLTIPAGKTLVIPIACDDADGDILTYTVTSSAPNVFARVRTGNPQLRMEVHTDNDGSGQPYDGVMEFQLFRDFTPETASFLAGYAQSGFYDNLTFHRIIQDFVIQGGDPAGTGSGITPPPESLNLNLNYSLPHEFRPELIFSGRGQLAMANSTGGYTQNFPSYGNIQYRTGSFPATNGTQFFITLDPLRAFGSSKVNLDFKHTIFGQLIRGFDVMEKVEAVPKGADDKPTVAIKMASLSVAPSKTDAVLLVSATRAQTSTLTVTAKDPDGNTDTRTIIVTAAADTVNDPPLLEPMEPIVMPVGGTPNLRIKAYDLESDAISTRIPVRDVFGGGQIIYAGITKNTLNAVGRPAAGAWDLAISVAGVNDPLASASPFDASRFQTVEIGVGDKPMTATPVNIEPTAGVSTGKIRVATFRHGSAGSAASDYTAVVNWGDGSKAESFSMFVPAAPTEEQPNPPQTSPRDIVRSPYNPSMYEVVATHTYARPGVYPLRVTVDGPLGSTDEAKGMAVVTAAGTTLKAMGQTLEYNANPLFGGRPVATFSDSTPGARIANYRAIIDWGDGQRLPGVIRQTGVGQFAVFGTHRYQDPMRYSVAVHIQRVAPAAEAVAWTSIKMGGFPGPGQLPPFPKASLTSYWSQGPFKVYRSDGSVDIEGALYLINGGQKATGNWKIRAWLSSNDTLETSGPNADRLLTMGPKSKPLTEIALNSLPSGAQGNFFFVAGGGVDFTIHLPPGETGAGKYVIAQLAYSDPITDLMAVPKNIDAGPLNGILVTSPLFVSSPVLTVKEGLVNNTLRTAVFRVRLDTKPTANVTIPIEIVNTAGTADTSRATLDKAQLVFTPDFGNVDQTVLVSSVDDAVKNNTGIFYIRLKPAVSTDLRFNGMDAQDITLQVLDNE